MDYENYTLMNTAFDDFIVFVLTFCNGQYHLWCAGQVVLTKAIKIMFHLKLDGKCTVFWYVKTLCTLHKILVRSVAPHVLYIDHCGWLLGTN